MSDHFTPHIFTPEQILDMYQDRPDWHTLTAPVGHVHPAYCKPVPFGFSPERVVIETAHAMREWVGLELSGDEDEQRRNLRIIVATAGACGYVVQSKRVGPMVRVRFDDDEAVVS